MAQPTELISPPRDDDDDDDAVDIVDATRVTRVYVTIGPSPELPEINARCDHGQGHIWAFSPAVWMMWGEGYFTSILDKEHSNDREFMCLCMSCALRVAEHCPPIKSWIDRATKIALSNGLHQRAVAYSKKAAEHTLFVFKEVPSASHVEGAMERQINQYRTAQHQLEHPEDYVKWKHEQLVAALQDMVNWPLTECQQCDTIETLGRQDMTTEPSPQPVIDAVGPDLAAQLEVERANLQSMRSQIAAMVDAGTEPEIVGELQARANEMVMRVVALESKVHVPEDPSFIGGDGMADKGGTATREGAEKSKRKPASKPGAAPKPKMVKEKTAAALCWDGCGNYASPGKRFVPAHDSIFKSMLRKVERGDVKLKEMNARFQEVVATLPKCTTCGNHIWGGTEKNEKLGIVGMPGGPGAPDGIGPECEKKHKAAERAKEEAAKATKQAANQPTS